MTRGWKRNLAMMAGGVALTAVSFVVVPPILNRLSRKVYKASVDTSDIDFEDMGPEIVRKDSAKDDEE